jgi:hypothetical protein
LVKEVAGLSDSDVKSMTNDQLQYLYDYGLNNYEKLFLVDKGYSNQQISNIDKDEFERLKSQMHLSDQDKKALKNLYPELSIETLNNWTYSDADHYVQEKNIKNGKSFKHKRKRSICIYRQRHL